jgi:sugar lactone lactonase YvrE
VTSPGRGRLVAVLSLAALLAAARQIRAADDDPSIPIRPFGAAPERAAGAAGDETKTFAADALGAEPVAMALDTGGRMVYWAEAGTGRIRRAPNDGGAPETLVEGLDVPVALALDLADGRIYWATDGNFPRRIQRARLDGTDVETLVSGEDLNRPGALAVDAQGKRIYWVDSVSGRVRRADLDGSSVESLHEERILTSLGLALVTAGARMYWTDLTHARIQRARLDGGGIADVLTGAAGLDVPTGLAVDAGAETLYWADRGAASIRRATLDGNAIADVLTAAQGVVDPRAVALDGENRKLYWSDLANDEIRRANLDGSSVETVVRLAAGFENTVGATSGDTGPTSCGEALATAGRRFAQATYKSVVTCLDKMSWIKAVKWRASDPRLAAATCATSLAPFAASSESAARTRFASELASACDPAKNAGLASLALDASGATCGKEAATSAERWSSCVADRYEAIAFDAVAARYARALEWLEEARPFVRALASEPGSHAPAGASAGVQAVYERIAKLQPARQPPANASARLSATGLVTAYAADKNDGKAGAIDVADDGAVRAGAPLRFRDNGDGTVTDLNTRLMWEKKCDGCSGLHDSLSGYRWSGNDTDDTIWDWLDQLNAEGGQGFAGHRDWRIPNVKELVSIVDYERFNPAVSTPLDHALCGLGCNDLKDVECSCTASGPYWSATTFSDFPAHALMVLFNLGLVGDDVKTTRHFVRAVRGPVP